MVQFFYKMCKCYFAGFVWREKVLQTKSRQGEWLGYLLRKEGIWNAED